MGDSQSPRGSEQAEPSAAELEAQGQSALFGDAPPPSDDAPDTKAADAPAETKAEDVNKAPPAPPAPPAPSPNEQAQPYRVLARKYRPQNFAELIGQEPMVRTLANAIKRDRLAHAFLMTGVRGVGKTTTARLIAKALNCIGPDGKGGPTIHPCGECEPCRAIAEGRHIDVIEMDAASHTGVDDVREIIEAVRYAAVSARYKIYIIDEVHMLSRNAFNALLKTLEEPPAHVKFLFATTEVEKLPVTVLSRTQRFDLRRIPEELLRAHFAEICAKEGVEAEEEALHMLAAAAQGSVRDGLSILDQAIAYADLDGAGTIRAERLREMLGLADRTAQRRLFEQILKGDAPALLASVDDQYALGVEPLALMRGLMDIVHRITLSQLSGAPARAPTSEESDALGRLASDLGAGQLHRLWQLLLKGHEEVRIAPDPLASAQMALLRMLHAAHLPDPGALMKRLDTLEKTGIHGSSGAGDAAVAGSGAGSGAASGAGQAMDWRALVKQLEDHGQMRIAQLMHDWVRVIALEDGRLVYALVEGLSDDPAAEIRDALLKLTGKRWRVEPGGSDEVERAQPSLREQAQAKAIKAEQELRAHPMVEAALEAFPEAELLDHAAGGDRPDALKANGARR